MKSFLHNFYSSICMKLFYHRASKRIICYRFLFYSYSFFIFNIFISKFTCSWKTVLFHFHSFSIFKFWWNSKSYFFFFGLYEKKIFHQNFRNISKLLFGFLSCFLFQVALILFQKLFHQNMFLRRNVFEFHFCFDWI